MKYRGFDDYICDEGEPVWRSCWHCNGAHEHLKDVAYLHYCVWCGRSWIFGHYLDEFTSAEAMDEFMAARLEHIEKES